MQHALPRLRLPSRKHIYARAAKQRKIARNRINLRLMRRNNNERPRTRSRHSRSHERARRPPDSAERPTMPRFEAGDHIGKAAMNIQISGQLPQPPSGLLPLFGNLPIRSRSCRGGRFHKLRKLYYVGSGGDRLGML